MLTPDYWHKVQCRFSCGWREGRLQDPYRRYVKFIRPPIRKNKARTRLTPHFTEVHVRPAMESSPRVAAKWGQPAKSGRSRSRNHRLEAVGRGLL